MASAVWKDHLTCHPAHPSPYLLMCLHLVLLIRECFESLRFAGDDPKIRKFVVGKVGNQLAPVRLGSHRNRAM